jgi:hypothetical protein
MRGVRPAALSAALSLLLGACATPTTPAPALPNCVAPARAMVQIDLYFGRDIAGRAEVSEAQWARFVDLQVTPRFPAGLTVTDARGQYRDADSGRIDRERSKRLTIIVDDIAAARSKLDAVAAAYKAQFQQQSVLRVEGPVCAVF